MFAAFSLVRKTDSSWRLRPASEIAAGCVEVLGDLIDGISTINDRKPRMTNKKPATRKHAPARQPTKLDAAMRSNMAHQSASSAAGNGADSAALQPVAEMLTKLSPSNAQLVENIIRCILVEQENKIS